MENLGTPAPRWGGYGKWEESTAKMVGWLENYIYSPYNIYIYNYIYMFDVKS